MLTIANQFFGSDREVITSVSPGRLDVMGGIADYSGSLLLQMPIHQKTTVSLGKRHDNIIRVYSTTAAQAGLPQEISFSLDQFYINQQLNLAETQKNILAQPGGTWAIYVLGCFYILLQDKPFNFSGADVLVESEVPFGKGVSSSAAIEVATLMAINQAYHLTLGHLELPILAQKVENIVVGAPCGLMDQLSSYLGEKNKLLPIICQPCEVFPAISIPDKVHFIGIDSGVKHEVSGSAYTQARVAAFMGYSIIAHHLGITKKALLAARKTHKWNSLPFEGYLANITVEEFERNYFELLPNTLTGADFTEKYTNTIDPVTSVNAAEIYAVKNCTAHPVYENSRVWQFRNIIETLQTEQTISYTEELLTNAGHLMYASHRSYSACGLGNKQIDELVEMVKTAGHQKGLFGAKITGGGSGGTVCILAYDETGLAAAKEIHREYSAKYILNCVLFEGSSNGGYFN